MTTIERRHELKTWPAYFAALVNGSKKFDIRRDDRDFRVGDLLMLREWNPNGAGQYTGRQIAFYVTYVLSWRSEIGGASLQAGHVVMALTPRDGAG